MERLSPELEGRLVRLAEAMVDQTAARVAVAPQQPRAGFWFGGGNVVPHDDGFYLVGRFRNFGDSRTGLGQGMRGLELAVFRADDRPGPLRFEKVLSWSKTDLDVDRVSVLSIEGSALRRHREGWELFVSSEKQGLDYPDGLEEFLKPGAGVWTIDRLAADNLENLRDATPTTVLASRDPRHLHVKDPNLHVAADGSLQLVFCTHPFNWSSSNTGFAVRSADASGEALDKFNSPLLDAFPRGTTWDVAMSRTTCIVDLPLQLVGSANNGWGRRRVSLVFYDGGESLRPLEEHQAAVRRPRGYSCEELGGVAYMLDDDVTAIHRLSTCLPQFVSPHGTGCSRYVQSVWTDRRGFITTWQQSQNDLSQPLVLHSLSPQRVASILQGE